MKVNYNIKAMRYLLFVVMLLTFLSCEDFFETTLELDIPEYEEQVVISAVFDNLDKRDLLLTKTVGLNGDLDESKVDDAVIKLLSSSGMEYPIERKEGTLTSTRSPNYRLSEDVEFVPGETYTIEVTTKEGKVARGTTQMPPTPNLISAKYNESGGTSIDGAKLDAVDIVFKDPPNEENFYRVKLSYKVGNLNSIYLESNDPSAEESADFISLILSDVQFDGEEYRLQLLFWSISGEFEVGDLVLEFKSITEDQYKFDKLLKDFIDNDDNPFNSATQLYTNIEGGLGLFTIENSVEMDVEK